MTFKQFILKIRIKLVRMELADVDQGKITLLVRERELNEKYSRLWGRYVETLPPGELAARGNNECARWLP